MISEADTKAILQVLSDALPDEGQDLLTSIEIAEDSKTGQLEVRLRQEISRPTQPSEAWTASRIKSFRRLTAPICISASVRCSCRRLSAP